MRVKIEVETAHGKKVLDFDGRNQLAALANARDRLREAHARAFDAWYRQANKLQQPRPATWEPPDEYGKVIKVKRHRGRSAKTKEKR